jgi:hypothetical protein
MKEREEKIKKKKEETDGKGKKKMNLKKEGGAQNKSGLMKIRK